MTAFLSLLAAALIASAGADAGREPAPPAPVPAGQPAGDQAPGLITPFDAWAGLDPELVRLPGAAGPVDPSAGTT
ncbi:hypothetical protein [Zeimonas arvi]|uniref:Uncharacterized protein n=1 Tax=Zeimonas arvi TaxID=2498847 RepID=A0A5C8P617_9BURK|nr:hypothetical protein [Zeimonas arvi]TXL68695.1 hypothetical protein FHP08_03180 [Zeimonas arvi]